MNRRSASSSARSGQPAPAKSAGGKQIRNSKIAASTIAVSGADKQLQYAREIIEMEARALETIGQRLDASFCRAVELIFHCTGSVIVCGMGKAGLIGQKIAATLASTGTRSHFLHPAEAIHGDLGRIHEDDVVLMLSQSGETEEIGRLLPSINELGTPLVAITCRPISTLGRAANFVIDLGPLQEACSLGLAPSTSTTAMLAVGDALALVASRMRGFSRDDFARFHPGGSLGRQLARVDDCMRPLEDCRVAVCTHTLRQVLVEARRPGRRTGAIMIVDHEQYLRGIFTDSDLARLFESRRDSLLDEPIRQAMIKNPTTVPEGSMMSDAVAILTERRISELPVIDSAGHPVGMLDITDIIALPQEASASATSKPTAASSTQSKNSAVPRPKNPVLLRLPRNETENGA